MSLEPQRQAYSSAHLIPSQELRQRTQKAIQEKHLSLEHVARKVQKSLSVDRTTKKFYEAFKAEHHTFMRLIEGIAHQADREWYTSVTLSRLMLVYFIQKKGFLDGDEDYLFNHLTRLRSQGDQEKTFFSFYRAFLLRLFHEGFGQSEHTPQWQQEFGYVPYLNGGLFEEHHLEQRYPDLHIPNEAFEHILTFFAQWQWRLDTRAGYNDTEINPEVLGYIFEQFTNQKEKGTYYTKEDITEYITKHAILSHLCDKLEQSGTNLFASSSLAQRLLQENPDRYFYPAMKHGTGIPLPVNIADGMLDVARRTHWMEFAPKTYAFPTETWREAIERHHHFETLWKKLVDGKITSIDDITSYNLDIVTFMHDLLRSNQQPAFLYHFYTALSQMTLLDPTCGSGAFLLAAVHVLKQLYKICLQQMDVFVTEADQNIANQICSDDEPYIASFRSILLQFSHYPNSDFFVLKSIIMNNVYGIDIKPDVVEICRLRLFLTLLTQIDTIEDLKSLPDVEMNVYSGNSLLGFTTLEDGRKGVRRDSHPGINHIEQWMQKANALHHAFQALQSHTRTASQEKDLLKVQRSAQLRLVMQELNTYLAREHNIDDNKYSQWQQQARPFHWFIQFYKIMKQGGFSVIVGNPPYVEYTEVKAQYTLRNYATFSTRNLYALVMERSAALLAPGGRFGMIVPSSATCTEGYLPLQRLLLAQGTVHIASFSDQRGKLFAIPHPRLCIIQYQKQEPARPQPPRVFTTSYLKLEPKMTVSPFERLTYIEATDWVRPGTIPRFSSPIEYGIARKLFAQKCLLGHFVCCAGNYHVYYTRKLSWFVQVMPFTAMLRRLEPHIVVFQSGWAPPHARGTRNE